MQTDGKEWKGVEYGTEEAAEALYNIEKAFEELFCKLDTDKPHTSCLERSESDGFEEGGIDYMVGIYCLGGCEARSDPIEIDLVTDGNGICGWIYHHERYKKGLDPFRRFQCEPIDLAKRG